MVAINDLIQVQLPITPEEARILKINSSFVFDNKYLIMPIIKPLYGSITAVCLTCQESVDRNLVLVHFFMNMESHKERFELMLDQKKEE